MSGRLERKDMTTMFIETEDTPNPATLKFLPGRSVTGDARPVDFGDADVAAGRSELASALFDQPNVRRVFLGGDFVSVTKSDDISWGDLKPVVLGRSRPSSKAAARSCPARRPRRSMTSPRRRRSRQPHPGPARHPRASGRCW